MQISFQFDDFFLQKLSKFIDWFFNFSLLQIWKEGMSFDAFYRKRKALSQYLPPSERHKLKVERPRPAPVNSPLRTVVEKGDNQTESSSPLTSSATASSGKRRPSDPMDSEADISNDGSRMNLGSNEEFLSNGEAQPPMKRSNTVNGNNGSTVNGNNGVTSVTEVETASSMTTSSWVCDQNNERKKEKSAFWTKRIFCLCELCELKYWSH